MANLRLSRVLHHLCRLTADPAAAGASDQQLLERFVAGQDEDAFTALLHRHGPMVAGVCRRLSRETHDAEDAFQATFLVLARKAASIRKGQSLGSWLHGVALRVARKARVQDARRARRERQTPAPAAAETCDALTWGELRAALDEELGRLPLPWRGPLILCYLEGQTQDEAARRLGWSKSTLRRRLEHGRRLLRSRLARRGLTLSAGLCAPLLAGPAASAALPKVLTAATVPMALRFGSGQLLGREALANPVTLAEAVLNSMVLAKGKWAAVVVLTLSLLAGADLCVCRAVLDQTPETQEAAAPPSAQERTAPHPAPASRAAVDQFGDPLPVEALARLGTVRFHHGASARALAFAPDGRSLASAGLDDVVHIWATATGKELLRIDNERFKEGLGLGAVFGLAFAPDGKTLAVARLNQPACLYQVATGKELRQFGGDRHRASWVVFSPDGKTLAYGGGYDVVGLQPDVVVRLADVNTGKDLHRFEGHKGYVTRVAFSPDGTTLATTDERTTRLFDIATGRCRELPQPDGESLPLSSLAPAGGNVFSPDGTTLAAVSHANKLIRLVDVATGKARRTITLTGKRAEMYSVLFTPDGKALISGHDDGLVRFWDAASGARTRQFRAHRDTVIALALSPDGRTLATSSNSHTNGEHAVRLWETATGKPLVRHPGPQEGIARVVFSPDSRQVATTSWEDAVDLWEAATGKRLRHWAMFGAMAFTPDGQTLVCGGWEDGKVRLLDLATGKEVRQFQAHAKGIHDLSLARNGKTVATAGNDRFVRLWDLATGRQVQDFGGQQKHFVYRLAWSPDAKLLAMIHDDYAVRLWDTATGKVVREHPEAETIGSIAFSPDGQLLASTSMGALGAARMIRLREVATGKELRQLRGQGDGLDAVAFSPDGRTLIWGGQLRKELYLWEVATGQLRRKFAGHQGHLACVAFSPDGRMMASGGSDASVLIWDVTGQRRQQQQPTLQLSPSQLDKLWSDLAASDAATAYRALCTLETAPRQAIPLLERHLKPVPQADPKRLAEALRDLDSDQFTVRNRATKELERLGEVAEPALRQILDGKPSLEVRQRVEQLLERFGVADQWRQARALEVLEHVGDPAAHRLLTALARGAPLARLTKEAQGALDRLDR